MNCVSLSSVASTGGQMWDICPPPVTSLPPKSYRGGYLFPGPNPATGRSLYRAPYHLALEMASPGNQHRANCIGTLSFHICGIVCWLGSRVVSVLDSGAERSRDAVG